MQSIDNKLYTTAIMAKALLGEDYHDQIADSAALIRNDSGDTLGVVLVFRDVTEEYALPNLGK